MQIISKKSAHQALACAPALFVQFLVGIGWGWTAPTLPKLLNGDSDFRITSENAAWLGAISEIGRIMGPFVSPLLLDNVGRKNTLILVSITFALIWAATIFARNVYVLLAIRIVFGIGSGVNDVASGIYVTEVCSPNFRGIGVVALLCALLTGAIFSLLLTTYATYTNAAIVITVVAIWAVISTYFGVETTYFLTMKDKLKRARRNFAWLEASSDIDEEFEKIRKYVEEEREKRQSFKLLFNSVTNSKALFIAVGFYLLYSSVGFHTIILSAPSIFESSSEFTVDQYTILYGAAQFAAVIYLIFVVEKIDRRFLIMYSFGAIACCSLSVAVLLYLHDMIHNTAYYPWLLFFSTMLYGSIGLFTLPVVYVITAELLPLSIRAVGLSMAITASSVGSFITMILFWLIAAHFGIAANFVLHAARSLLMVVFVHFVVNETRGKPLYEMRRKPMAIENPCA